MGLSKLTVSLAAAVAVFSGVPAVSADSFNLYGYNDGSFAGQQLVYKDDLAWIVTSASAGYETVTFARGSSTSQPTTFLANGTSFTNKLLYVPSEAGGQVGFTDSAAADQITDEFVLFEGYVYVDEGSSLDGIDFRAVSVGTGVYAVVWKGTNGTTVDLSSYKPN